MSIIENLLKVEMIDLVMVFITMAIIRLVCDLITKKISIKVTLARFIKLEVLNVCLIAGCVLIDHAVLKSFDFFRIDIAIIASMLLILDEFISILSDTKETATSHWLLSIVEQLRESMVSAFKKK